MLRQLAPQRGDLLWDVGSGSGSVAIEWMLADPSLRAVAIERHIGNQPLYPLLISIE